jgi:PAS domain S-box-containing protein/putative nucleotidyltransferase with HDIG domain
MRLGAQDYIMKNNLSRLCPAVARELAESEVRNKQRQAESQKKAALEAMLQSEEKYRTILENIEDGYYEVDLAGNLTFFNDSLCRLYGYSKDALMGMNYRQYADKETAKKVFQVFNQVYSTGKTIKEFNWQATRKDGTKRYVEVSISLQKDSSGKITGFRGLIHDITERKQQEKELLRANKLLNSIVENIPDMIFLKDSKELRFVRFNRAGEDLLGHSRENLLGKSDYDLFPHEQAELFTQRDREVLDRKELIDIAEESIQTRNRGERTLHTQKVPILNENGEPEYLLGISEDITERKLAEAKLLLTLESLKKAVGATIQVLVVALEARDPYTAGHQLRVAHLACAIAMEMGLAQQKIDGIQMAGSIHDIGKLSIPAEILSKPTKLTNLEFSLIKEHAQSGYEMLKDVESPWPLAQIVYQHHERINGSGYPRNLKGDEILVEARIMAVADVVEAMASHRPYRPGLGIEVALEEIEKNKGIFYDDNVADACLNLFREKDYKLLT